MKKLFLLALLSLTMFACSTDSIIQSNDFITVQREEGEKPPTVMYSLDHQNDIRFMYFYDTVNEIIVTMEWIRCVNENHKEVYHDGKGNYFIHEWGGIQYPQNNTYTQWTTYPDASCPYTVYHQTRWVKNCDGDEL